jgi:5'-deoxynucleotidase
MTSKEDSNFFAMLSRMKYINRWGLMRNTINENIAEHSLDVSIIAHALGIIHNVYFDGSVNVEKLAVLGMFHDTTEIITGDLPTPIKYFAPEIKDAYKSVEMYAGKELVQSLPVKMQEYYTNVYQVKEGEEDLWRFVKAADKISALIKCEKKNAWGIRIFWKQKSPL